MTRARNTADELSLITAKGDLLAGSASGVQSKLTVGSNNTVLIADSSTATGLKWGSVATTKNFSLLGTGTLTGAATITVSGISGVDDIYVIVKGASSASASAWIAMTINSDGGSNYKANGLDFSMSSAYSAANFSNTQLTRADWYIGYMSNNNTSVVQGWAQIRGCNTNGKKMIISAGNGNGSSGTNQNAYILGGLWDNSATVTSISLVSSTGNFDAGTFEVYGAA